MKRKRKPITETVHPDILERARIANEQYNQHLSHGHTVKHMTGNRNDYKLLDVKIAPVVSLDLSVLMVELASFEAFERAWAVALGMDE